MIELFVLPLLFSFAVSIKGGWVGKFWKKVPSWVDNHLPPVLIAGAVYAVTLNPFIAAYSFAATYVFKFSMGEEAGAVINNIGNNEYIDTPDLGRSFGIKKAIQRGVIDGAAFSLAFWNPLMIIAGLSFVPVYWGMSKLKHKITGTNDWAWAEPVYGLVFGLFASLCVLYAPDIKPLFNF